MHWPLVHAKMLAGAGIKESVYIETTIVSYLTAWPSRDIVRLGHQMLTRDWWDTQRNRFETGHQRIDDSRSFGRRCSGGGRTTQSLSGITTLNSSPATEALANALVAAFALPPNRLRDALHIATAAGNGIDYLLTWNCKHLANGLLRKRIEETCSKAGLRSLRLPYQANSLMRLTMNDEIDLIEEARKAGQAYVDSLGGDVHAVCADLQKRAEAEGRTLVSYPPKPPHPWQFPRD